MRQCNTGSVRGPCVIQNSSTFRRQQVLYIFPKNCVKIRFSILEYTETEKDLGILMNRTLNFTDHSNFLYGRANKGFGLFKRTYPFVHSIEKGKFSTLPWFVPYLSTVLLFGGHPLTLLSIGLRAFKCGP